MAFCNPCPYGCPEQPEYSSQQTSILITGIARINGGTNSHTKSCPDPRAGGYRPPSVIQADLLYIGSSDVAPNQSSSREVALLRPECQMVDRH